MFAWYDIVGYVGVGLILIAYLGVQIGKMPADEFMFPSLNLIGACLIMISLYYSFNAPSFVIEIFWIAISIFGLIRAFRKSGQ